jgi:hypothetical protein
MIWTTHENSLDFDLQLGDRITRQANRIQKTRGPFASQHG